VTARSSNGTGEESRERERDREREREREREEDDWNEERRGWCEASRRVVSPDSQVAAFNLFQE